MNDKKNRAWIEVNLDNLIHNYRQVKEKEKDKEIICVIKADAYGHGAVAVASALSEAGATYFAVATAEEALQLRRHGIKEEILLLGTASPSMIKELTQENIILTVSSERIANTYAQILQEDDSKARVHLKVNSGMDRQGISLEEAVEQVLRISKLAALMIEGIYTHLAAADDPEEDEFTKAQYENTLRVVQTIRNLGLPIPLFHIANSAGIISHPYMRGNMVRPGIMLYGSNPRLDTGIDLKPTLSLHTKVSNLLKVKKGETVGYGRTWTAKRESVIAVLSIGYADGLMRCLSGRLPVLVNGQLGKQVGRICMDMCMIDVTDVSDLMIGDTATIIGIQSDKEITADDLAKLGNTISYEIFCAIGKRVPRIYLKENKDCLETCYIDLL